MSQFSDSFVVLRRQRNTLERRWKKIGSSWVFYKYTLDNFTHYTKIILLRARLQLLGDSMTHLVRSGIKRMVFLFCNLSIFFGPRLWLEREYVVHVASLISYRSKSEVYYPDFSTLWNEKIWRLIRRRMALTFYIYLMFSKNGIINQFSDISYCETQKVKYTRNIQRRFLRYFFLFEKQCQLDFRKLKREQQR